MRLRSNKAAVSGPVFVTVGTTSFDALVEAVDDPAFVAAALKKGFTSLTIQARLSVREPRASSGSQRSSCLRQLTSSTAGTRHVCAHEDCARRRDDVHTRRVHNQVSRLPVCSALLPHQTGR